MLQWCDCYAPLVGRILMGGYFLWSGVLRLASFSATVAYLASAGLPSPEYAASAAVIIEIGLGLALVLGFRTRTVCLGLVIWMILITLIFFQTDSTSQESAATLFLKNIAIIGGLLYMSAFGSGGWSLGSRK